MSGTALSQLIGILATIVLARIYSPDAFGVFGSSLALCTIMSVMVILKFDLTVIFPKKINVASLCTIISLSIAIFFTIVAAIFLKILTSLHLIVADYPINQYAFITFFLAFEQIAINWLIRTKSFKQIAYIAIAKTLCISGLQYYFHYSDAGLWHGYLLGNAIASAIYLIFILKPLMLGFEVFSIHRFFYFIKKYKKFPIYSLPAGTFNTFGNQIPILLIRSLFGEQFAGYYLLIRKIILAPVILISTNINKVLSQEVSNKLAHNKPYYNTVIYFIKLSTILSVVATLTIVIFMKIGGLVLLLGKEWQSAELLAYVLLPIATFSFVAKSVSRFAIYGKNEWGLIYQFVFAAFSLLSIYVASALTSDFILVISYYSLSLSIIYITQVLLVKFIAYDNLKSLKLK